MRKAMSPVKKKIFLIVLTLVTLSLIVFLVRFVGNYFQEKRLNEARNDFTFVADWRDMSKTYDSERGVFTYHWKTGVSQRKAGPVCGSTTSSVQSTTYVAAEDTYLSVFANICSRKPSEYHAQIVLTYDEINDLITVYEEKREQNNTAPTPSFEERKDLWRGQSNHSIRAYQKGFLIDYYGVVYYFEPDGDSFTVSSFDNVPPVVNFQLVGEDQNKLLLIENNAGDMAWYRLGEPKTIYLYDIASQKIEKLGTTKASIDSFCVNKDGTRFAYLNFEDGEYPTLNIYDLKEKKLVKTSSPIRKMGIHTSLNDFKLLTLLDTDEVVATRTDEGLMGSEQTVVLLSEQGQKKAPKALQEFYIETGVSGT